MRYLLSFTLLMGFLAGMEPSTSVAQQPQSGPAAKTAGLQLCAQNPRYLAWNGKPTLLVTSGEHYGAVLNLDFDYRRYLDELQAAGLNHTRTFTGVYREDAASFNITHNTLAPAPEHYVCPWARSDQPGYAAGGNRFDLTRFDEAYFARLKDFLKEAASRGIIVELTLFCPLYDDSMWNLSPMKASNNVNGIGNVTAHQVHTLAHADLLEAQVAVTRRIASELRDFDNLYYEICNEPYFGGVTLEWQHRIVDTIVEAEKDFERRHLISMNIANGRQKIESPHPNVSIFNFHYCVPPDVVALNADLPKVIGENETGFRGSADELYRTEGWDFILAGGGLYNNLDYSFTTSHPDGTLRDYKSPGGGSPELRRQLGFLRRFVETFDFVAMQPDNNVVAGCEPAMNSRAMSIAGKRYAIYLHVPLPESPGPELPKLLRDDMQVALKLRIPAGQYNIEWFNTRNGQSLAKHRVEHDGGELQLASPMFANDVAIAID